MKITTITNGPAVLLLVLAAIMTGCSNGDEYFADERYEKMIGIISDDDQIFHAEYEMTEADEFVKTLAIGVSGTNPIDHDVTVEVERDADVLTQYNYTKYMDETDKYAKELTTDDYSLESSTVGISTSTDFHDQVAKLPIKIKASVLDALSVDDVYMIPLRIKSASPYPVNKDKENVLYRVYKKNAYASQREDTYYNATGYTGSSYFTSEKKAQPLTHNSLRVYVGSKEYSSSDSQEKINASAMIITVNADNSVSMAPYSADGGLTVTTLTPATDPADPSGSYSYGNRYDPEEKIFYLYYSYDTGSGENIVREQLTLE